MIKKKFNSDWVFQQTDGGALSALMGGDMVTRQVTLPHDASVESERNPQEPGGSGNGFFHEDNYMYKKTFFLGEADAGKNVWFEFEGVYQNAFVYINNAFAGKCPYGYSNFYVDATSFVRPGEENEIKVIVRNGVASGRWYTGGGIYRDVNLMICNPLHIACDGVKVSTPEIESDMAVVNFDTTLEHTGSGVSDVKIKAEVMDAFGRVVAKDTMSVTVIQQMKDSYRQKVYVDNPALWSDETPNLYTYKVSILQGDEVVDEEEGTFGIRQLQLDPRHGLRVNGKVMKLRGGCIHHDNGITGTAEFGNAAENRVRKLKAAGFNAIRASHYPMSRKLLEACDKLGMYVMDEYSDVWTTTKVAFDYGIHMAEWWEHDITNMVKKDFNHPCVIMYSIGNEIPEIGNKIDVQWGKKLADKIRSLDDTRYVTNSMNILLAGMELFQKMMAANAGQEKENQQEQGQPPVEVNSAMAALDGVLKLLAVNPDMSKIIEEACAQVDIAGFNYSASRYELDGENYPNRVIVGSETNPKDLDENWELVQRLPYVIGDFDWTAWDYLGETGIGAISYGDEAPAMYSPYPFKAAYCGDINLIGDRRPISYWREIIWGLRELPYIAVRNPEHYGEKMNLSGWSMSDAVRTWNFTGYEGRDIEVEVYSPGDEVALYVNGDLIERKPVGQERKAQALFHTVYTPGKLEAVSYVGGVETGRDVICTADSQVVLQAVTDQKELFADGSDIVYIALSVVDGQGILNTEVVKAVSISVEGPAVAAGFGSADPKSEENYFDTTVNTYQGRLLAAIRANGAGDVKVKFEMDGAVTEVILTAK